LHRRFFYIPLFLRENFFILEEILLQSYKIPGPRPIFISTESKLAPPLWGKRPFFHMLTETGVASLFLEAVAADTELARMFVSKNCAIDLEALQSALDADFTPLVSMRAAQSFFPESRKTRAITLGNRHCIWHVYMVEEPDRFGPWKICGVEKE